MFISAFISIYFSIILHFQTQLVGIEPRTLNIEYCIWSQGSGLRKSPINLLGIRKFPACVVCPPSNFAEGLERHFSLYDVKYHDILGIKKRTLPSNRAKINNPWTRSCSPCMNTTTLGKPRAKQLSSSCTPHWKVREFPIMGLCRHDFEKLLHHSANSGPRTRV